MDPRDQKLYKFVYDRAPVMSGSCDIYKDDMYIGSARTIDGLSSKVLRDYFDDSIIECRNIQHIIIRRLNEMFTAAVVRRRRGLGGYAVCGVAIRELIRSIENELKMS